MLSAISYHLSYGPFLDLLHRVLPTSNPPKVELGQLGMSQKGATIPRMASFGSFNDTKDTKMSATHCQLVIPICHPGASLAPPACEPRTGLPWLFAPPATRNQRQWVHMAWKIASLLAKEKVLQVDKFLSENWDVLLLQHFKLWLKRVQRGKNAKITCDSTKCDFFGRLEWVRPPHQRRGCQAFGGNLRISYKLSPPSNSVKPVGNLNL